MDIMDKSVLLVTGYFDDYIKKYRDVIDGKMREIIESMILIQKEIMLDNEVVDDGSYDIYDDECFICGLTVANMGKRVIHVFDHIKSRFDDIIDLEYVYAVVTWFTVYEEYISARSNGVEGNELTSVVLDLAEKAIQVKMISDRKEREGV